MAKPRHKPTDQSLQLARSLSGLGVTQNDICVLVGISKPILHKYYREELDRGMAEANAKVAESLFRMATKKDNVAAAIFWMKARAGWREKIDADISVNGRILVGWIGETLDLEANETPAITNGNGQAHE